MWCTVRRVQLGVLTAVVVAHSARPAAGQQIRGRVVSLDSQEPLRLVRVALIASDGHVASTTMSDNAGFYVLAARGAGSFRVQADIFGYQRLRSPLLALPAEKTVVANFAMPLDPIELEGLRVEVEARRQMRRELRSYGVQLDDLGERFVSAHDIAARPAARDFGQILQWQSIPSMSVTRGDDVVQSIPSVCVTLRTPRSGCAMTVLDGAEVTREAATSVPAGVLRAIVVLTPRQARTLYGTGGGDGAVLLFTRR